MPAKKPRDRRSLRRFWNQWGVVVIVAAGILVVGAVALLLRTSRGQEPQINTAAPYRIYFTQGDSGEAAPDGLEAEILRDIEAAERSIAVAAPGLDLPGLAAGLIAAQGRGVQVRVLEDAATQQDPDVMAVTRRLQEANIPVVLREARGSLGGSLVVVDERLAWAGSWDLSRQGLEKDEAFVLRWNLAELAGDLHDEFMEMFADRSFGPTSPRNTTHPHLAILDVSSIAVYMTPEDDPYAEILQSLAGAQSEIILLTGGLDEPRLSDRLVGESGRGFFSFWAVIGGDGSSEEVIAKLRSNNAGLLNYRGSGQFRQNAIIIDARIVCIFSQPLREENLYQDDGYIFVVRDTNLGAIFQQEFTRLVKAVQSQP